MRRSGDEQRDGVRVAVDGQPPLHDLGDQRVVGMDHAFGLGCRSRRVAERHGFGRIDVDLPLSERVSAGEVVEVGADGDDPLQVGHIGTEVGEHRLVVDVTEALGGDVEPRVRLREDEANLAALVDVHDRRDDGAGERASPEAHRGFDPVGELERHDVARADPAPLQRTRELPGALVQLAECATEGSGVGPYAELEFRRCAQVSIEQTSQRLTGPEALGAVSRFERRRNGPHRKPITHVRSAPVRRSGRTLR